VCRSHSPTQNRRRPPSFGLTRLTLKQSMSAGTGLDGPSSVSLRPSAAAFSFTCRQPRSRWAGRYRSRMVRSATASEMVAAVDDVFVRKLFEAGQSPTTPTTPDRLVTWEICARAPHYPNRTGRPGRNPSFALHQYHGPMAPRHSSSGGPLSDGHKRIPWIPARGGDVDRVMHIALTRSLRTERGRFGKDIPIPAATDVSRACWAPTSASEHCLKLETPFIR